VKLDTRLRACPARPESWPLRSRHGKFSYRMSLPADADADKTAAERADGILTVRVPKGTGGNQDMAQSLTMRSAAAQPGTHQRPAAVQASRFSFLALPMALFMFGYAVRVADRFTVRTAEGCRPARPYLAPRCAALCKIAMGITMGYTLILML